MKFFLNGFDVNFFVYVAYKFVQKFNAVKLTFIWVL